MSIWFVVLAVAALAIVLLYGVVVFQMAQIRDLQQRLAEHPRERKWEFDDEFDS